MRPPTTSSHVRRQAGFSLVELMISLAIGLLISAVIGQTYLVSKRGFRAQDSVSRMQENGRYAMQLLTREIRMAGFPGLGQETVANPFTLPPGSFVLQGRNDVAVGAPSTLTSDTVSVTFFGSGPVGAADGSVVNCLGTPVDSSTQITDQFFVAPDPNVLDNNGVAVSALWCTTSAPGAAAVSVALVHGIETMQILYGEDTDGDRVVNRYVAAGTPGLVPDNVLVVRVSLLVAGVDNRVAAPIGTRNDDYQVGQTYYHFTRNYPDLASDTGAASTVPADGRVRQLYHNAITVRNRV